MNDRTWTDFCILRDDFRKHIEIWDSSLRQITAGDGTDISSLMRAAAESDGVPPYPLENLAVYNTALDEISPGDEIKIIVIGDNPGKSEQLNINRKYLVGQAGKLAEGFFRNNPELCVDFRKNVIILNKTPVHTAKTKELEQLLKRGGPDVRRIIQDSHEYMARLAFRLQQALSCSIWLVGYSELKPAKLFTGYRDLLLQAYRQNGLMADFMEKVLVFQHFSMNCFTKDLKKLSKPELTLEQNLQEIGQLHRREIFGL